MSEELCIFLFILLTKYLLYILFINIYVGFCIGSIYIDVY